MDNAVETKTLKERIKFQLEFMLFMLQVDRMDEANSAWANALELIDQIEE